MLCQTAIVYSRRVDDRVLTFGHEGVLYLGSFVMYDRETGSLWVHTTGEAVKGELKGKVLQFLPSTVTTWRRWKTMHPRTTVLTGARGASSMGRYGLGQTPEDYGLSVGQGAAPKLYPMALLAEQHVVNDTHGGKPIVVVHDPAGGHARAYLRGERTFAWKGGTLIDDRGVAWDAVRATQADGKGTPLQEVPATVWLIKRWKGFYPHGPVYRAPTAK